MSDDSDVEMMTEVNWFVAMGELERVAELAGAHRKVSSEAPSLVFLKIVVMFF